MRVRLVEGAGLAAYTEGIRRVYADVFSAPPWNEAPAAASAYVERLLADAQRPGFTAALASTPAGADDGLGPVGDAESGPAGASHGFGTEGGAGGRPEGTEG